jgi:hypothetical protein
MISKNLSEVVSAISGMDDPRTVYAVRYRGEDTFALSESEGEAIEEVARSYKFVAGIVPLAACIAALTATPERPADSLRGALDDKPETKPTLDLGFKAGIPSDEALNKLSKEQLQDACQYQKPPIGFDPRAKKIELIGLLGARRDSLAAQGTLPIDSAG